MWRLLSSTGAAPQARSSHSLNVIGRKIYLFGGEQQPRVPVDNNLFCYDLDKKTWNIVPSIGNLPSARLAHAAAAVGSKLYIFGGRTGIEMGEGTLNDMHCFDTETEQWTEIKATGDIPEARSYHAITSLGNNFYMFGGCSKDRQNDLHRFDTSTNTWYKLPSYDQILPRGGPGLAVLKQDSNSYLYVVAGFAGKEVNDMFRFNLNSEMWETLTPEPNIPPISVFGLASTDTKLVLCCGETEASTLGHAGAGNFTNDVYIYDSSCPDKGWIKKSVDGEIPSPRGWMPATISEDKNEVFLFGGNSLTNERLADLFTLKL